MGEAYSNCGLTKLKRISLSLLVESITGSFSKIQGR